MKVHSDEFKQQIKTMGKEIDSIITIGSTVLGKNELNAVTPTYQGALLKSVMKELNIDSNVDIPLNSVLNYKFGVKVNGEYEYLDFGDYVVYKSEKQEDTNSYKITCYDKMLYSMVDYANMNITYPITIRDYINKICEYLGLTFANSNDTFANYDKEIPNELYLNSDNESMGFTFRDVLDQLAQVTASTICINDDDELEIRYITETGDTIDEEYLKDVNVNFGEKYGKINSIVLSRGGGGDNIYLQDEESVATNGLCEIKIENNEIMNFNDRSDYLPDILEKLNGLEFYINDFTSTGVTYYDLCDRYNVKIGDNVYSCVMFNDEINVTQGLEEIIYTELPEETETDYKQASKTDRLINQTYIIANQHTQEIEALTQKVIPVSNIISGIGEIQLENAYEGRLHYLSIKGNISLLYPSSKENLYGYVLTPSQTLTPSVTLTPNTSVYKDNKILYPSNELFSKSSVLLIDDVQYKLDFNFLNYLNNDVCDEFIYEDGKCKIVRRVGVDSNGKLYKLENEVVETKKDIELNIKSNSTIKLKSFDEAILKAEYLLENEFTSNFITQIDAIARLNLSPGKATLQANKIALEGYTTINNGFSVDEQGNATMQDATITGGDITLTSNDLSPHFKIIGSNDLWGESALHLLPFVMNIMNENRGVLTLGLEQLSIDNLSGETTEVGINSSDYLGTIHKSTNTNSYIELAVPYVGNNDPNIKVSKDNVYSLIKQNGVWSGGFNNNSQESKKKNIVLDDGCLEEILESDIVNYHWNYEKEEDKKHIGLVIADNGGDYKTPDKVTTQDGNSIDLYSMNGMAWKAIQELYEIIQKQQKEIDCLKEKLKGSETNE